MSELKSMTVQALRDLARKALGRGHSKLKTKGELVEALQAAERKVAGAAEKAAARMKEVSQRAAKATEKVVEAVRAKGSRAKSARGEGKPTREAASAGARAAAREREAAREAPPVAPRPEAGAKAARRARGAGTEPDPEGYMVARVAGEEALRGAPHPLTESALDSAHRAGPSPGPAPAARGRDEALGDLPWAYGDDALVALPRDPTTLFLYWDHGQETLRDAWAGLEGGRPQLFVFIRESGGEWTRVRTLEFALESRSYYVHDLEPGRVYRAEIHVVDRKGRDRLLPRPSNEMMLPPVGPSPVIDDRFMRILWSEPLRRLLREAQPGGPFSEDLRAQLARLSDWSRFAGRAWGGSAGGMGGRPFSPTSSPSSPAGPWGHSDGKGR